ncbi:MAG TPA: hypothetical protein VK923_10995 [Euzebyales bacterium]|nr:hypothetical protein [Euzebyales bacterium]
MWGSTRAWYGRHLDADWRTWTVRGAVQILARFGLTGDTWGARGRHRAL